MNDYPSSGDPRYQQSPQPVPTPQPQPYYRPAPQVQAQAQPYYQPVPQPMPQPQPQPYYQPAPLPQPPLPEEAYKKTLRSKVMKISLSLFLFYVVNVIAVAVILVCSMIFTGSLADFLTPEMIEAVQSPEASVEAVGETITENFSYGLASIVGIVAGSLMLLIVRGKRMFTEDLTKVNARIRVPELFKMLGLILGINGLVSIISVILLLLAQMFGASPDETAGLMDSYMNPVGLLYVVLLGPIFEEVIFRGAILRTLQPFGENFAIVLSSLLFGLYHLFLSQGIFAFFVGLVLAYCTLRYSIKWAMLLHIANNGLAMLISLVTMPVLAEFGIYALYLVFGIVAILLSIKAFCGQLQTGKPTSVNFAIGMPLSGGAYQPPAYAPAAAYGQVAFDPRTNGYAQVAADPRTYGYAQTQAVPPQAMYGYGQVVGYGQTWVSPYPTLPKPKPYAIAFSSAWLIVALTIAFGLSTLMMFVV